MDKNREEKREFVISEFMRYMNKYIPYPINELANMCGFTMDEMMELLDIAIKRKEEKEAEEKEEKETHHIIYANPLTPLDEYLNDYRTYHIRR